MGIRRWGGLLLLPLLLLQPSLAGDAKEGEAVEWRAISLRYVPKGTDGIVKVLDGKDEAGRFVEKNRPPDPKSGCIGPCAPENPELTQLDYSRYRLAVVRFRHPSGRGAKVDRVEDTGKGVLIHLLKSAPKEKTGKPETHGIGVVLPAAKGPVRAVFEEVPEEELERRKEAQK